MPINPIKEFFKRKKAEVKFARAGPGHSLAPSTSTSAGQTSSAEQSSARQAAAEAAMKRFNKDNTKPSQRQRIAPETRPQNVQSTANKSDTAVVKENLSTQRELPIIDGVVQRNVQVYSTEELAQRIKQPDIDDDFFRLTVEDAKLFKQRYDEERARNEILRTSEMRRREAEAKKPTVNYARLRFKLPNNQVLEASFSGGETLSSVREWLIITCKEKSNLMLSNIDILLGLRPFKEADFERSVKQLGLIPATTLTIILKNT